LVGVAAPRRQATLDDVFLTLTEPGSGGAGPATRGDGADHAHPDRSDGDHADRDHAERDHAERDHAERDRADRDEVSA